MNPPIKINKGNLHFDDFLLYLMIEVGLAQQGLKFH